MLCGQNCLQYFRARRQSEYELCYEASLEKKQKNAKIQGEVLKLIYVPDYSIYVGVCKKSLKVATCATCTYTCTLYVVMIFINF